MTHKIYRKSANKVIDLTKGDERNGKKKFKRIFKVLLYSGFAFLFFGMGVLATTLYYEYILEGGEEDSSLGAIEAYPITFDESDFPGEDPIRSPLNGVVLTDEEYEILSSHPPHAVMISNNKSARDEQYGLSFADIVYEAETEAGITRFMALFWTKQEGFIIKPVRSVRKYFLEWALEYGQMPVTFSGFAHTTNPDTNAFGFYKEYKMPVTYFDWPFKWDEACLATQPSMHCKRTSPEVLYSLFSTYDWTYDKWKKTFDRTQWQFSEEIPLDEYFQVHEFSYQFTGHKDWTSRWVYNKSKNVYHKYEPDDLHLDMNNQHRIAASTVVIQKIKRSYAGDAEGRVIYQTVGSGDAYILRDGRRIEAVWEKECYRCRTVFHAKHPGVHKDDKISFNPGLIWIAAVPTDREITWQ